MRLSTKQLVVCVGIWHVIMISFWIYYLVVGELIDFIAHGSAWLMGCAIGLMFIKTSSWEIFNVKYTVGPL